MNEFSSHSSDSDESARAQLENSIRRGTRWVILAQVASQLVSIVVLAALFRLVGPGQYGLLGMVVPLLLVAKTFASFGLNVATVQQRNLTDGQLSTVFWASLVFSALVALAIAAIGPVAAWFHRTPQVAPLIAVLAGTLVVAAVGAQHQALLERNLRIGRLVVARLLAQAAGGTAAIFAAWFAQWGVWALVVQQYIELAVLAALAWYLVPWRPCRWSQSEPAGDLLKFGGYYSLSSLMFALAQNADKILIAWLLGATHAGQVALGFYTQAFNLMMKPVYLVTSPITGIMLPALSRVAHRNDEFESLVTRFYRMVAIILFPCGIGLAVVAIDLMPLLGGQEWYGAGYFLLAFAPIVLVQGLLNISGSVFAATGNARSLFFGALVTAGVMAMAVLSGLLVGSHWASSYGASSYGASSYGGQAAYRTALVVACCYSAATVLILALPYLAFCFRTVGISFNTVLASLARPAAHSIAMGVIAWGTNQLVLNLGFALLPRLVLVVVTGVATYVLMARREICWFVEHIGDDRG